MAPSWSNPKPTSYKSLAAPAPRDWEQMRRTEAAEVSVARAQVALALTSPELHNRGLELEWRPPGNEAVVRALHGTEGQLRWKGGGVELGISEGGYFRPAGIFRDATQALIALDRRDDQVQQAFRMRETYQRALGRFRSFDPRPIPVPKGHVSVGVLNGQGPPMKLAVAVKSATMVRVLPDVPGSARTEPFPFAVARIVAEELG